MNNSKTATQKHMTLDDRISIEKGCLLYTSKGVEIIEGHLMPDHIHMLVSIPPKYSISQFMRY